MTGLWCALSSDEELEPGESYRIALLATIEDDLPMERREAVEELLESIGEKLDGCDGIEVRGTPVTSLESDVTLANLRRYQRLDDWDDLSRG